MPTPRSRSTVRIANLAPPAYRSGNLQRLSLFSFPGAVKDCDRFAQMSLPVISSQRLPVQSIATFILLTCTNTSVRIRIRKRVPNKSSDRRSRPLNHSNGSFSQRRFIANALSSTRVSTRSLSQINATIGTHSDPLFQKTPDADCHGRYAAQCRQIVNPASPCRQTPNDCSFTAGARHCYLKRRYYAAHCLVKASDER